MVLLVFTDRGSSSYRYASQARREKLKNKTVKPDESENLESNSRRQLLKGLAGIPFSGCFRWSIYKESCRSRTRCSLRSTIKVDFKQIKDLKGKLQVGKLGDLTISKMVLGCNLIGGWSHARDLIYSEKLFKAYNNERKIIETLYLAEQAGINTTFMVTQYYQTFNKYKKFIIVICNLSARQCCLTKISIQI